MVDRHNFSVGSLSSYSDDEIASYYEVIRDRYIKLANLSAHYNDQVRDILNDESLSQDDRLYQSRKFSELRDITGEMRDGEKRNMFSCQIEYDLRQRE